MIRQQKIIKDPLYDYISIDDDIFEKIIDTKFFQRLRRIEQTSMRCLYPSARHDRFIHSIGTYYLAKVAIEAIEANGIVYIGSNESTLDIQKYSPEEFEKKSIQFTFEMAALLHDIGHSPFSHTLEDYFKTIAYKDVEGNVKNDRDIIDEFFDEAKKIMTVTQEEKFNVFTADCRWAKAAPHEITSCIIAFKCFREILDELAQDRDVKINYCFLARCILGAQYSENSEINDYKNCVIKLLNSSIDVDKLDYIARDSKVSGFDNTMVDTKRLLNSLVFALYQDSETTKKLCLAFKKTALGVIQNVVMSRNSLYTWIYSHHKVKYESYLIHKAIELISKKDKEPQLFISKYFSVKNIQEGLVCDDTIWNLFMQNLDIPEVCEIIQRNSQKKAIWKSFAEFQAYFNTSNSSSPIGDFSIEQMQNFLNQNDENIIDFKEFLNKFDKEIEFELVINKTKLSNIEHNSILIYINNQLYGFDAIFSDLYKKSSIPPFFYLYCTKKNKDKLNSNNYKLKNILIDYIKKYDKFKLEPYCNNKI